MLKFPAEISERILTMSDPFAVAAMAQTCSFFRHIIYRPTDQHLWRSLFLDRFDDPRTTFSLYGRDINRFPWAPVLQRRVRVETLLSRYGGFRSLRPEEQFLALATLIDAVYNAPPPFALKGLSRDLQWVRRLIEMANVFLSLGNGGSELIAKLHAYYGLSPGETALPAAHPMRTVSRCFLYDLRKYSRANLWGPFLPNQGGRVSWVHIDHIIRVITMNLEDIVDLWEEMRPPTGLEATRPYSAPGTDRLTMDWAGIEGKWYRFVCFMDYRLVLSF